MTKELVTTGEAALITGLSKRAIQKMCAGGQIPGAALLGSRWTISELALRDWAAQIECTIGYSKTHGKRALLGFLAATGCRLDRGKMMAWNFNIGEAPKDQPIIAAGNKGIVTLARWIEKEGRWSMFTKAVPPLAWQPWPQHPTAGEAK